MSKEEKIIIAVAAGVLLLILMKKSGGDGEKVTENYSPVEGWLSGAGGFAGQLNNVAQDAIDNATDQVIKIGDRIHSWRMDSRNNGYGNMIW